MNIKIQMIPLLPLNVKNWSPQHGIQHPNLSRVQRQTLVSTAALTSGLRAESSAIPFSVLQCDYCNRGHQDKVDQLDCRKIKIHSEKAGCRLVSSS